MPCPTNNKKVLPFLPSFLHPFPFFFSSPLPSLPLLLTNHTLISRSPPPILHPTTPARCDIVGIGVVFSFDNDVPDTFRHMVCASCHILLISGYLLVNLDFFRIWWICLDIDFFPRNEAQEQHSLLNTIFDYIFYFGPPGKYL